MLLESLKKAKDRQNAVRIQTPLQDVHLCHRKDTTFSESTTQFDQKINHQTTKVFI